MIGAFADVALEIAVVVPAAVIEMNEADAALCQSPCQQAIRRERAVAGRRAVEFEHCLRLVGHIDQLGHRRLHAERRFVRCDAGLHFGALQPLVAVPVELLNCLDARLLQFGRNAVRAANVVDRVAAGVELDALKAAGQKAGAPLSRGDGLIGHAAADAGEHDEAGQIVGLRSEAVVDPGAHRRPAADGRAAVHKRVGRVVIDLFGDHRADDADVVDNLLLPRQQLAHPLAALAVAVELEHGAVRLELLVLQLRDRLALGVRLGHRLIVEFGELGLVVEGFEVRWAAGHAEEDHALGLGGEMRQAGQAVITGRRELVIAPRVDSLPSIAERAAAPTPTPIRDKNVRRATCWTECFWNGWLMINSD